MQMRTLGQNGPRVSAMGLGCMRMSGFAGSKSNTDEEGIATIQAALEAGINFLNTGDFYGMGHNETGSVGNDLPPNDVRRQFPKFDHENLPKNLEIAREAT